MARRAAFSSCPSPAHPTPPRTPTHAPTPRTAPPPACRERRATRRHVLPQVLLAAGGTGGRDLHWGQAYGQACWPAAGCCCSGRPSLPFVAALLLAHPRRPVVFPVVGTPPGTQAVQDKARKKKKRKGEEDEELLSDAESEDSDAAGEAAAAGAQPANRWHSDVQRGPAVAAAAGSGSPLLPCGLRSAATLGMPKSGASAGAAGFVVLAPHNVPAELAAAQLGNAPA